MDNERKDLPQNEGWLDDILGAATPESEIGPDESAVAAAGLIHPDDMELEMIMAEHKTDDIADVIEAAVAEQIILAEVEDVSDEPVSEEHIEAEPERDVMVDDTQFFTPQLVSDETDLEFDGNGEDEIAFDETSSDEYADEFENPGNLEEEGELEEVAFEDAGDLEETGEPEEVTLEEGKLEEAVSLEDELPPRKGRPKVKKGYGLFGIPHLLSTAIWFILIVAIGVSLGRTLWLCCSDLMAFGKAPATATITITDDDTIDTIAQALADNKLIRYPGLFKKFAEVTGKAENISVGTFTLGSHLDYNAMINSMAAYAYGREEVTIMFPEGYTCAQIFSLLEENNVCTVAELEECAANGELEEFWFLEGVERGDKYCLEGYLFPDTYTFYTNDEPDRVLEKFLYAFDSRFTDLMRERLVEIKTRHAENLAAEGYDQDYIDAHEITVREIVIIASMIEKESAGGEESYDVSSVIYNRLEESSYPPYLNIDAAVIYGLGGNIDPVTGEVKPLTQADLQKDTPYNTYLHTGLTPGPISNPGQESLNAALTPNDTDYYYYALDPATGKHKFFEDSDDFERFLESVEY